ncbi:MAG: amino acid permease [Bacteroidales bacterium]|nr:amino acid permease [Bacteroidales bacterium]MCF8456488.1 amino acid permease [Bacteroidales bacterium]
MAKSNKFGAFKGVFTPSILTILGVIMYMRLPMIVGESGLFATLGIIVVAHIISITTGLSVSSIATDKKVEAGGTYFIISRSLGLPIGGTLGLALFVGLSFSVSLYLIGFAESFLSYWGFGMDINSIRIAGSAILLLVTILTFISTSLALKTQYFIMAAIFLSLISIFFGKHDYVPELPNLTGTGTGVSLMVLFGIFFPAVTGFEAGVSMSGDLKDPKKSIPVGTLSAVLVGLVAYIFLAFFFSYSVDGNLLKDDPQALLKISWIPELVIAGIWGATLSSALGSILGAPRILQATALDKITPKIFAKGVGPANEPRNALILSFLIAEAGILIGDLDIIARIVSIFFITTYGFLNLSSAFEAMTSADFRPSFKTPIWASLVGSAACFLVMIQLDFVAMLGATVILGLLFLYLKRKELSLQTGDTWGSIWASMVKYGIAKLSKTAFHHRNWRPNIIMFCGQDNERPGLIKLGNDIVGKLGMLSGFEIELTDDTSLRKSVFQTRLQSTGNETTIRKYSSQSLYEGMDDITRLYGIGGFEPNTVFIGWSKNPKNQAAFQEFAKNLNHNNFNSIFFRYNEARALGNNKTIDIWWSGQGRNLSFAIGLIRHLTASATWKNAKVRLLVIAQDANQIERAYKSLHTIVEDYRVTMEIEIINNSFEKLDEKTIIADRSQQTDLAILCVPERKIKNFEKHYDEYNSLTQQLGSSLLISGSTHFEEYNLFPVKTQLVMKPEAGSMALPDLAQSQFTQIAEITAKVDAYQQESANKLFIGSFQPIYIESIGFVDDIKRLIGANNTALQKILWYSDKPKQSKVLKKARNDFYFKLKKLIESFLKEKLTVQRELLGSGLSSFQVSNIEYLKDTPSKIRLVLNRKEFLSKEISKEKIYKLILRSRLTKPFLGKDQFQVKISYRDLASYFMHDQKQVHLADDLQKIQKYYITFLGEIKGIILEEEVQFESISKKISDKTLEKSNLDEIYAQAKNMVGELKTYIEKEQKQLYQILKGNARNGANKLVQAIDSLDPQSEINQNNRGRKYYKNLLEANENFASQCFDACQYFTNRLYLEILLNTYKNRVKENMELFSASLIQKINSGLLSRIKQIQKSISDNKEDAKALLLIGVDFEMEWDTSFDEFYETLRTKTIELSENLPENITIAQNIGTVGETVNQTESLSLIEVPAMQMSHYLTELRLLSPVKEELEKIATKLNTQYYHLKDLTSYLHFEIENIDREALDRNELIKQIVTETQQELNDEIVAIEKIQKELSIYTLKQSEQVFSALSIHKIKDSSEELSHLIREVQSRKSVGRLAILRDKFVVGYQKLLVQVLYTKSEGILLANELSEQTQKQSIHEQILNFVEKKSPKPAVFHKIPNYYKSLFSGKSSISHEFWIERPIEENQFAKALVRYNDIKRGGIMVIGERNSGKTALCRYLAGKHFEAAKNVHVHAPVNGSVKTEDFLMALKEATKLQGNAHEIIDKLPHNIILVIHDLELWWERTREGGQVIALILELIKQFGHKTFFVVNLNNHAHAFLGKLFKLENYFFSSIYCRPFDAEEIKDLILTRHRSSGLRFNLRKKEEQQLSKVKQASLFNKYFKVSKGNPGQALQTWLTSVQVFANNMLTISEPVEPNHAVLENLPDEWSIVLAQILIHKRVDSGKLSRITGMSPESMDDLLTTLLMSGLLTDRGNNVFMINYYVNKEVSKVLTNKEII